MDIPSQDNEGKRELTSKCEPEKRAYVEGPDSHAHSESDPEQWTWTWKISSFNPFHYAQWSNHQLSSPVYLLFALQSDIRVLCYIACTSRLGHTNAGTVRSVSWPEVQNATLFHLNFPIKALGSGNGLNLTAKRDALCYIVQEDRNAINDDLHLVSFSDLVLQSENLSPAVVYIVLSASGTSTIHIVPEWSYATIAAVAGR